MDLEVTATSNNRYQCRVPHIYGVYITDDFDSPDEAASAGRRWLNWYNNVKNNTVSSVYYILAIPDVWAGPPPGAHPYSGLRVKIGIAKNIRKRFQNLKTGSFAKLIIHAIEPGGNEQEKLRHKQFSIDRLGGEWFNCSEALARHMVSVWIRNNLLPGEHQMEVAWLQERIEALRQAREIIGRSFDMVNPSVNDEWHGNVLLDLRFAHGFISRRPVKEDAYPVVLGPDGKLMHLNAGDEDKID